MTEQKAIAEAVLNTPEPDRFVDCGESRPLPMFHMATLMQYGEQCANAALAYLCSQGELVGEMQDSQIVEGLVIPVVEKKLTVGTKLYLAPVAKAPEGWQLVPKEPTETMARAMKAAWWSGESGYVLRTADSLRMFSAALAAAPEYKEE